MCEKCKYILKEFIDIHLGGEINYLKRFDFTPLGIAHQRDCDRLRIVTAIYCLTYSHPLNLTTCLLKTKIFNQNCGDTLNTYNSSFGKAPAGRRAHSLIDESSDESIKTLLSKFKSRYLTVGNFMPLPNVTYNRISINTARNSAANDYADLFFEIVKNYYDFNLNERNFLAKYTAGSQRKGVQNLAAVMVLNSTYFKIFNDFSNFVKLNHLEAFYKEGRYPLFNHSLTDIHFKNSEDVKSYLVNSIEVIEERSEVIVEKLKHFMK